MGGFAASCACSAADANHTTLDAGANSASFSGSGALAFAKDALLAELAVVPFVCCAANTMTVDEQAQEGSSMPLLQDNEATRQLLITGLAWSHQGDDSASPRQALVGLV